MFGFLMPVSPRLPGYLDKLPVFRAEFRSAMDRMTWSQKEAAAKAGMLETVLSRQLLHTGPSTMRLVHLGHAFWKHFLKGFCLNVIGLSMNDIYEAFGADLPTEAETRKQLEAQQERIEELERHRDADSVRLNELERLVRRLTQVPQPERRDEVA